MKSPPPTESTLAAGKAACTREAPPRLHGPLPPRHGASSRCHCLPVFRLWQRGYWYFAPGPGGGAPRRRVFNLKLGAAAGSYSGPRRFKLPTVHMASSAVTLRIPYEYSNVAGFKYAGTLEVA